MKNIQKGKFNFKAKIWGKISKEAKQFIKNALERRIRKRMTTA